MLLISWHTERFTLQIKVDATLLWVLIQALILADKYLNTSIPVSLS